MEATAKTMIHAEPAGGGRLFRPAAASTLIKDGTDEVNPRSRRVKPC